MRSHVPPRIYGLFWIGVAITLGYHTIYHPTDFPTVIVSCIAVACLTVSGTLTLIYGPKTKSEN